MEDIRTQLVNMARHLGDPARDYAILGEGNVSARQDRQTFWVKASGSSMPTLEIANLVQVSFERIEKLLGQASLSDGEVRSGLEKARIDDTVKVMPSVETFLHAILLQLEGVNFVGHTHPTAILSIMCSQNAQQAFSGSLFPDQIVYCGPAVVYVPYTDPGLPLALRVRDEINAFADHFGEAPKVILMQNHGLITVGKTPADVENITAMCVKAARVILGTYQMGGPSFLSTSNVERIHSRPDEHYRKQIWGLK